MSRRRCSRCQVMFDVKRAEVTCGCPPLQRTATCTECGCEFVSLKRGRPRKTCDQFCAYRRELRVKLEASRQERAEAQSWWLSLTLDQKTAAMAWVNSEPVPETMSIGRQAWAYINRAAFSCEERVVSGVR